MRNSVLFSLILCLHAAVLAAQTDVGMAPADMESIDYSDFPSISSPDDLAFKLLAPFVPYEDLYVAHADGGYRRIQPVPEGLSSTHYYSGNSPLTFYRKSLDEKGEVVFLPVSECPIKGSMRDIIVCLQRLEGGYRAFPIDLSLDTQPLGSVRFVNFTPAYLVVLLGEERAAIEPKEHFHAEFDTGKKTYFNFKIGAMYENEAKVIFSSRYPFRGEMRILFIGYATMVSDGTQSPFRVVTHYDRGPEARPLVGE